MAEPPPATRGRAPFAGRGDELARLLAAAERVPTAGLVAVAVTGEAGIGKSRLLGEAAERLAGRGWRTLVVHADRLERRVPYAVLLTGLRAVALDHAFTEALRRDAVAALDPQPPEPRAAALGAGPVGAGPVESRGAAFGAGPVGAGSVESRGAAFGAGLAESRGAAFGRACAAVTRLLTALAAAGPLVVLVDDLPELDDDSLALLTVALRRLSAAPIALVAALRAQLAVPNAGAQDLLDRLADEAELVRVELGTLAPADLAAVITPVLGAPPDDDLAAEVHRRADGNPFFAAEIARSLAASGLVALDAGTARLAVEPRAVRLTRGDAVLHRVLPLTADARAVARVLAVLRTADLGRMDLIARVTGRPEPAVAAAFDDLVRAGVVRAGLRAGPDAEQGVEHDAGYRFAHEIVADALYDEIGPAERRRLHRLVAEHLLDRRGRGEPVDLLELAGHVAESAAPGETAAVQVLGEAARRALRGAPETAAGLCARALALLPVANAGGARAGLLALRCRALARASRPAEAVEAGRAALGLLPPGEDRVRTATAVISSLFLLGRIDEAIEVADDRLAADPAAAGPRAQRAVLLAFAGRNAEALREAEVAAAATPASPAEEVVVCGQLAMLTSLVSRHAQTVEFFDRALRSAGASPTLQLQALAVAASTGALAGLVPDAARRLRRAERLAEETGQRFAFSGELGLARVALDWLGGRWDAALDGLRAVAPELETRGQSTLAAALRAIELDIRTWRGELVPARRLAAGPVPVARNMADLHAVAVAGYLAAVGDPDGARRTLRAALGEPPAAPYACLILARLAELELDQGRPDAAAAILGPLAGVDAGWVSPWSATTLHRTVGTVRGDPHELRLAVREAEAGDLAFERARAQLALGELAPREPGPGEPAPREPGPGEPAAEEPGPGEPAGRHAVAGLVEAYQTFARLGAHGLRRRAGRRLHELGEKVPRARSRSAGLLTESEERVARLVQQGMRNREIAAALHYSPRSIEVYLSRVYAKLHVSSRLELARALDAMDAAGR